MIGILANSSSSASGTVAIKPKVLNPFEPSMVKEVADIHALRRHGVADGMRPLRIAGALKMLEGATTAEEILTVTASLNS